MLALAALQLSCSYDVEKIFKHEPPADALPEHLIDLWKGEDVSDACRDCAREQCALENDDCKNDPSCLALTQCMSTAKDPAAQNNCRAEHVQWLSEAVEARDIGGPYQQCAFLSKCTTPCEGRTQLSCTNAFTWPSQGLGGGSVSLHLRFADGLSGKPPKGMRVRACQALNSLECIEVAGWETVDDGGQVVIDVGLTLGSFTGYLELDGGGVYPSLLRFGWPIVTDVVTNVTVVSRGSVESLLNTTVADVDRELGLLQTRFFGCTGVPTRGVSFSVDMAEANTLSWYTAGTDISPNFEIGVTGDRGAGGVINVPVGTRRLSASYDDLEITRNLSVPSRKSWMTIVMVVPDDSTR